MNNIKKYSALYRKIKSLGRDPHPFFEIEIEIKKDEIWGNILGRILITLFLKKVEKNQSIKNFFREIEESLSQQKRSSFEFLILGIMYRFSRIRENTSVSHRKFLWMTMILLLSIIYGFLELYPILGGNLKLAIIGLMLPPGFLLTKEYQDPRKNLIDYLFEDDD